MLSVMMITMLVKLKAGEDHNGDLVIQSYDGCLTNLLYFLFFLLVRYKI